MDTFHIDYIVKVSKMNEIELQEFRNEREGTTVSMTSSPPTYEQDEDVKQPRLFGYKTDLWFYLHLMLYLIRAACLVVFIVLQFVYTYKNAKFQDSAFSFDGILHWIDNLVCEALV
jgi:hypothetical protein